MMNGDELKTPLSDDTLLRTLLAAQTNGGGASVMPPDTDRFTLLCMLSRHLPAREKALAERILLALLFMSLVGHETPDA